MMTVNEVSKLTGVSIRALQYYDKIGLLKPTTHTESGYRLYDDMALETLQQILLFRELEFPLKEIRQIMFQPDFDRRKALEQQIDLLTMKKEHLENLIQYAREIQLTGGNTMDFSVFNTKKMDEYTRQAKEQWGKTEEYREYEQKAQKRNKENERILLEGLMQIFVDLGKLKEAAPEAPEVQEQVRKLQHFITDNFYKCSDDIFFQLGQMYADGGEFTTNIDNYGGEGTAKFASEAIRIYCQSKKSNK